LNRSQTFSVIPGDKDITRYLQKVQEMVQRKAKGSGETSKGVLVRLTHACKHGIRSLAQVPPSSLRHYFLDFIKAVLSELKKKKGLALRPHKTDL